MSSGNRSLRDDIARYIDNEAFTYPQRVGRERADKLEGRRLLATRRAEAVLRFFKHPENLARLVRWRDDQSAPGGSPADSQEQPE